jgi:broad specificity phosphatase PhoE
MATRVLDAVRDIAARHPDERVLVVTSGGPIRAVEAHLRRLRPAKGETPQLQGFSYS